MPEEIDGAVTQKIPNIKSIRRPEPSTAEVETHESVPVSEQALNKLEVKPQTQEKRRGRAGSPSNRRADTGKILELEKQCRQLYLSAFFREQKPLRSIGFTSSLPEEGRSALSMMTARVLADDTAFPVTLLECDWQNPQAHKYFDFAPTPGLAEWLRGECSQTASQRQVTDNLTVIPAGNSERDAVVLLQNMRKADVIDSLLSRNELLVVDLPPITTTSYGALAAGLVEGIFIVVRAGVTSDAALMETCKQLALSPVEGLVFYQLESRIPGWLRQML
jgi:Mrp family chromosome partitioning ATPase